MQRVVDQPASVRLAGEDLEFAGHEDIEMIGCVTFADQDIACLEILRFAEAFEVREEIRWQWRRGFVLHGVLECSGMRSKPGMEIFHILV